jgi:NAD(P)H-hydrate epimerase
MKVVTSKQMAEIEALAYKDGASEAEFMEEAGSGVAQVVMNFIEENGLGKQVVLLCAKGNNSGDTYVAGAELIEYGYAVLALQTAPIDTCSALCQEQHRLFLEAGGQVREIMSEEDLVLPANGVVVDGLFGTGFHGQLREPYASIVKTLNRSRIPVISVDIPSGLNGETGVVDGEAVIAAETAFLGLPKRGFFLGDGWNHTGKLRYIDFGLGYEYIDQVDTPLQMITREMLMPHVPILKRNRHKYEAGYVIGIAGSPGMGGAALLSSWSSLTGGAGIVRLMHPAGMEAELTTSPYELIKNTYKNAQDILKETPRARAIFVGPGIGVTPTSRKLLEELLPEIECPCVVDADALTLYAEKPFRLPSQTIFTPHLGEMSRLLNQPRPEYVDLDFLHICNEYAKANNITLILKGGPTFVMNGKERIFVNPMGDPGMATAGSGDVLTGLLAALLAQNVPPLQAAQMGVFIHSWAGELAANLLTSYCMTASDIVDQFPRAFLSLQNYG